MNSKKKVFVVAVAVCLIAILSMSSLAWFSDSDDVTNQFMISTSDDKDDPEGIFSVDIWENVDTDGDGNADKVSVGEEQPGAEFKHIYPSQTLIKEPHVENTGKYDQWIRVKVTVTDAAAWISLGQKYAENGEPYDLTEIFGGHSENVWTRGGIEHDVTNDKLTYTYYLNEKLEPTKNVVLFTTVTIPSYFNQYDLAELDGGFELTLLAEAVQADNTGDTAVEAFALVTRTQEIELP